jgi:hypothetical protein
LPTAAASNGGAMVTSSSRHAVSQELRKRFEGEVAGDADGFFSVADVAFSGVTLRGIDEASSFG